MYPYEEVERGLSVQDRNPIQAEKDNDADRDKSKKSGSDSENENISKRLTRMQSKNESDSEIEKRETRSSRPRRCSVDKESLPPNRRNGSSADSSDESIVSSTDLETASKRDDNDADSEHNKNSEGEELVDILNSPQSSVLSEEKDFSDTRSEGEMTLTEDGRYPIGARVLVKYGKGKTHRAYEAKV